MKLVDSGQLTVGSYWKCVIRIVILLLTVNCPLSTVSAYAESCNVRGVDADAPVLCGRAVQGGFLYGESDWAVLVRNDNSMCSWPWCKSPFDKQGEGVFVIGLPMDAPEVLTLKFCREKKCRDFDYKIAQRRYKEQHLKVDDKFVHYSAEIQKRIDSENEKIRAARKETDITFLEFLDLRWPFPKKYSVSSPYGARRVFNGIQKNPHNGIDISAPKGAKVRPIGRGRVVLTLDSYLAGKTVIVAHGHGIFSVYIHLDKISAKTGDVVDFDSVIGTVGATGRASGPHLHLGLYHNNTALDPALLF